MGERVDGGSGPDRAPGHGDVPSGGQDALADAEAQPFGPEAFEPEPRPSDSRGRALVRLGITALLAGLLLWVPVTRLAWCLEVAADGAYGEGEVVELGEQEDARPDEAGGEGVVRTSATVIVAYGDPPRRTVFINRGSWELGSRIPLAWLPADVPDAEGYGTRVARVDAGAGVQALYFGIDGWPLDLVLVPLGLALALGVVLNLAAVVRPYRAQGEAA